jgi:hypothetical protein
VFVLVDNAALRRWLPLLAVLVGLCVFGGCSLFPAADLSKNVRLNRPSLPPIQTAADSVQLEVFFVDRPADDPLLGPSLWREIDQIAAIPAETRQVLHENGFLVGLAGSSPPLAVQTLLNLVTDYSSSETSSNKPMVGLRKLLPPGIETEVQASNPIEKCHVNIADGQRTKPRDYDNVRGMFRVKSARLRDGWVRIDFQPEIHHGDMKVRTTSTPEGWIYQNRQNVDVRHAQQFSLTMNVGEIAIITAAQDNPESMGDLFFRRGDDAGKTQRLLIVRVADGGQLSGAY